MSKIVVRNGKKYKQVREKCTCECHNPDTVIMHVMACCDEDGYNTYEIPLDDELDLG